MSAHLHKVGTRYYYRRRVPLDLVEHMGKKVIKFALGVDSRAKATELCNVHDLAYAVMFADHRRAIENRTYPKYWDGLPIEQLEAQEEEDRDAWFFEHEEAMFERMVMYRSARVVEHCAHTHLLSNSELAKYEAEADRATHQASNAIGKARASSAVAVAATQPREAGHDMDALFAEWEKARSPAPKTIASHLRVIGRFTKYVGNLDAALVTKAHIVQFKDKLTDAGFSTNVVQTCITQLGSMFSVAVSRAWREDNPCAGVRVDVKIRRARKSARPSFDVPTLNRIFSGPAYVGERPAWSGVGASPATYWLPLLGLYTGARVEELSQLHPEDVYEETYIGGDGKRRSCWVLRLTHNEERQQGVKTAGSVRRIPLHREMVTRGFIEFVASRRDKPRVFYEMKADKFGVESGVWSLWWIREYLRKYCSPSDPKMVFHSFRHTFKDVCRDHGITKEIADALQGHSDGDASSNYGGEFYPLRPLVEAMEKYEVHGVTLPPITK
ncbi:site-specific integrase [Burkholderia sp. MS455]|uniref:site-specific integrase n=1 Tax=Burkholderia sp. MS455 TaxID=2811788 RepID=UPI00195B195D|nr:site-specific integrase [Burkholderia sp. MS455]QRR06483.1 site-specific integrase [Burkholderia sp. MS455]